MKLKDSEKNDVFCYSEILLVVDNCQGKDPKDCTFYFNQYIYVLLYQSVMWICSNIPSKILKMEQNAFLNVRLRWDNVFLNNCIFSLIRKYFDILNLEI